MQFSKQKKNLYILIAAAVVVKLIILHFITNFRVWEENEMAMNYMATGKLQYMHDGVMVYNYSLPVYPFLLVWVYKIFGVNYTYAAAMNIIFSAITAVLLYDIFNAFFERIKLPERVKDLQSVIVLLSVAAYLFHPLIMFYEIKNVHPFAMYLFSYVLGMWLMLKYVEKNTWTNLLLFGLIMGLIVLGRIPFVALFVPFFLLLLQKEGIKKSLLKIGVVLIFSSVFPLLWIWNTHSKAQSGNLFPNMGAAMWMGSLPQTEGSNNFENGKTFYAALSDSDMQVISKIPAASRDSFYAAKYSYKLKHNPGLVAKMFLIKFENFWLFRRAIGVDYPANIQKLIPIYKAVYVVILLLALFAAIRVGKEAWILLSLPFAVSLIHAMVYVETRHRIMFEPLLIFLAIIGVALLVKKKETI